MGLVVFDGDDTLWVSEPLYDAARKNAREIVEGAGLSGERWEELQRVIDVANVEKMGLSAKRFPTSCIEAYEALVLEVKNREVSPQVRESVRLAAEAVFFQAAPLADGAEDVLEELRQTHQLALLTQGDPTVQRRRIAQSGLEDLFDLSLGVKRKDQSTFAQVLSRLEANARDSWSVGNSLASDINPALNLGMRAIWVIGHVWEYERREQIPTKGELFRVNNILDVPGIIERLEGTSIASA